MNEMHTPDNLSSGYQRLFETVDIPIAIVNPDGSFFQFNQAYIKLLGFNTPSELDQFQPAALSPQFQPNGRSSQEFAVEMINAALNNGRQEFKWTHKRPDGNEFVSQVILDTIDLEGEKRLFAVVKDISETLRLERIVQERTNELDHQAETDRLTGVYNREKLDQILKQEQYRANRYQSSFAFVKLDLDNFQTINETYGHDTGDKVLIEVAELIKDFCREADSVCRCSGEEFMIILPESNLDGAYLMADNLRTRLSSHTFSGIDSLTASFGVDMYQQGDDKNSMFKRVDQALRNAKETGKNCVEMLS